MSGFCGILNMDGRAAEADVLAAMASALDHRGPDGKGQWISGSVGLAHRLLKTTHESLTERQPLSIDEQQLLVADVRLDRRKELSELVRANGHPVSERASDAELVLHAYCVWGERCVEHLIGDFAFAVWDQRRQLLFCARDQLGMRSLYYAKVGDVFLFANTIDAIRRHPQISNRLNDQAVGDFLLFRFINWCGTSNTVFADVRRLPPAHVLKVCRGDVVVRRYWTIPLDRPLLRYKREQDYIGHFHSLLTEAVRDRLRADRITVWMSGGMDSTSVAATCVRLARESGMDISVAAVTHVYDRIHADKERYYSSLVAQRLGIPIHYVVADSHCIGAEAVKTQEPAATYTPTLEREEFWQLSQLARVALVGTCADALLYPTYPTLAGLLKLADPYWAFYEFLRMRYKYRRPITFGTGIVSRLRLQNPRAGASFKCPFPYPNWLNPDFERAHQLRERWHHYWNWEPEQPHPLHRNLQKSLILMDHGKLSEFLSEPHFTPPEFRDPYMDLRLVEFMLSIPPFPWQGRGKYLLRQCMKNDLPAEVLARPKTPLGASHHSVLKQTSSAIIDNWTSHPWLAAYINRNAIPSLGLGLGTADEALVNLQPFLLNNWLLTQSACC